MGEAFAITMQCVWDAIGHKPLDWRRSVWSMSKDSFYCQNSKFVQVLSCSTCLPNHGTVPFGTSSIARHFQQKTPLHSLHDLTSLVTPCINENIQASI